MQWAEDVLIEQIQKVAAKTDPGTIYREVSEQAWLLLRSET